MIWVAKEIEMPYNNKKRDASNNQHNSAASAKSKNMKSSNRKSHNLLNHDTLLLVPIILIVAVLPLIVRLTPYVTPLSKFPWFSDFNGYDDVFLICKKNFLLFISFIMVLIIAGKAFMDKRSIKFLPLIAPLGVYALLAFLSSVISKYRYYSLEGSFEQFESIYVILAYCIITYYVFLIVRTERDIKLIIVGLLFCVIVLSIIGITQTTGNDFFATEIGKKIMVPKRYWYKIDELQFHFGGWAYLTLYNPNYVGVYVAMVAPLLLVLTLFLKKDWRTIFYIIGFVGLLVCLYGSHTSGGFIGLVCAILFMSIFLWRYLLKYRKVTVPVMILGIISIIAIFIVNGNTILNQVQKLFQSDKTMYKLKDIETNDSEVIINYDNNVLKAQLIVENGSSYCLLFDENNKSISMQSNSDGTFTVLDNRFSGFIAAPCLYDQVPSFYIQIEEKKWIFTNQTEDGTYYLINQYGKYDKVFNAPSVIFSNYGHLFNNRGFIWSKTLPLLKRYIILGSGADTFPIVYPQNDYVNLYNVGINDQLVSKPHSIYLQIAVQYGVLSLIAFLVFYVMYFVSSFKLYIKGVFHNYYAQVGFGIFVSTFGYMICGITNDSNLSVAPIFWLFMGLGIVSNMKAKPFVEEELKRMKVEKKLRINKVES